MSTALGTTVRFEEATLYGLQGVERDTALNALAAGLELPFAISGDTLACSGELIVHEITEALGRKLTS